jgi:hypothetical protein
MWISELDVEVIPIMFIVERKLVINIQTCSPIFCKHVCLWCLLFDPHQTTYQSNVELLDQIKKTSHRRPIHLNHVAVVARFVSQVKRATLNMIFSVRYTKYERMP